MTKAFDGLPTQKEEWEAMFKSISDPEAREDRKRLADRKKRREERISDTGL